MAATDRDLLVAFRLKIHDRLQHNKTVIATIDRHLKGTDTIGDKDIRNSIQMLCVKFNINYDELVEFADHMYDGPKDLK